MSEVWAWLMSQAENLSGDNAVRLTVGAACMAIALVLLAVVVTRTRRWTGRRTNTTRQGAGEPAVQFPEHTPCPGATAQQAQASESEGASQELETRLPLASHPLRDRGGWRIEAAGPVSTQSGVPMPVATSGAAQSAVAAPAGPHAQADARQGLTASTAAQMPARPASAAVADAALDERADETYHRALALLARDEPNRAQLLRDALACFRQALEIWTRERTPERWAAIQNDIGRVYQELTDGDRASHVRTAIMYHQTALEVFDRVTHPMNWAWTQAALGAAYQSLPAGSSIVNARAAVAYFQRALDVFSRENAPLAWAWNQNNLGAAYETMRGGGAGERVARLRDAARCYEAALGVYTATEYPAQHRIIARNLARVRAELQALE